MNWKEKIVYIVTYYKVYFILAVCACLVVGVIVFMIREAGKENIGQGIAFNASFAADLSSEVPKDFAEYLGKDPSKIKMVMESGLSYSENDANSEYGMGFTMKVTTYIAAHALDFMITDTAGMRLEILQNNGMMDLEKALPEDIMNVVKDDILYKKNSDGTQTAIGINIKNSSFAQKYQMLSGDLYFIIINNTDKLDNVLQFLRFMYGLPPAQAASDAG